MSGQHDLAKIMSHESTSEICSCERDDTDVRIFSGRLGSYCMNLVQKRLQLCSYLSSYPREELKLHPEVNTVSSAEHLYSDDCLKYCTYAYFCLLWYLASAWFNS